MTVFLRRAWGKVLSMFARKQVVAEGAVKETPMANAKDVNSTWQILVPMVQLRIANEAPINGQWPVGDVVFLSRETTEKFLQPPNISAALPEEHQKRVLKDTQAFAIVRRQGTPAQLQKAVFREVREAANILAATDAFYGARHLNSGFNIQGYPIITARNAWFIDTAAANIFGNSNQEGALMPWSLDAAWHNNVTITGIIELFAAITDNTLDNAWRAQIRRAAACLGRSLMSLERADAFLLDVFALETLLTRPGERNGKKLAKRIKGITGWHLKVNRPNYTDELDDIFEARCDAVHDADYGNLTAEHLLLADMYAKNAFLNVVVNRAKFPNKNVLAATLDGWADAENWPTDGSYTLRWVGNSTFNKKDLDLPLW